MGNRKWEPQSQAAGAQKTDLVLVSAAEPSLVAQITAGSPVDRQQAYRLDPYLPLVGHMDASEG